MEIKSDSGWHLDKRVPIAFAVMIFMQTIALVYVGTTWKNSIDYRLTSLEQTEALVKSTSQLIQGNSNRLLILETRFAYIQDALTKIANKLDENQKGTKK